MAQQSEKKEAEKTKELKFRSDHPSFKKISDDGLELDTEGKTGTLIFGPYLEIGSRDIFEVHFKCVDIINPSCIGFSFVTPQFAQWTSENKGAINSVCLYGDGQFRCASPFKHKTYLNERKIEIDFMKDKKGNELEQWFKKGDVIGLLIDMNVRVGYIWNQSKVGKRRFLIHNYLNISLIDNCAIAVNIVLSWKKESDVSQKIKVVHYEYSTVTPQKK